MQYRELINKQVNSVFKELTDLKTIVTFSKSTPTSYNFNSGGIVSSSVFTKDIGVVVTKTGKDTNSIFKMILAKKADIPSLSFYDKVIIDDEDWKIGEKIIDNDFILKFKVFRP
jgi:hypothetical protein